MKMMESWFRRYLKKPSELEAKRGQELKIQFLAGKLPFVNALVGYFLLTMTSYSFSLFWGQFEHYLLVNLLLIFTVVVNALSEIVWSNYTIALRDLAVHFPNLLKSWTKLMCTRVRVSSVSHFCAEECCIGSFSDYTERHDDGFARL